MTTNTQGRVIFACGGEIKAKDVTPYQPGYRLVTGTDPHQGHSVPTLPNGEKMDCCAYCPSTVKASGRKYNRSGWFENGLRGSMMTCRVKEVKVDQ